MKSNNYKIVYNKDLDSFNIQSAEKFLWWTNWKTLKYSEGAGGHIWYVTFSYETEEKAIQQIIKLIARDEVEAAELEKRESKADQYKELVINAEILKEKFPGHLL